MSKEPIFTGVCTAIVTPFRPDGAIDYGVFGELIEAQIVQGVDAICVCGTTGESAALSYEEHQALISACVRQAAGRVKVLAGAGSNCTANAVRLSRQAQDAGADGLLHVTPYYNKANQTGLLRHYEAIVHSTSLPIILYNVPSRTGVSFTAETYRALSREPQINGVKEASGDLSLAAHTLLLCGNDLNLWSGNDDQVVPLMALGAKGVISVASNLIPAEIARMAHLALGGQTAAAAALQLAYTPLIDALFCDVNPIPIKRALELAGRPAGGLRLPLCELSPAGTERLRSAMAELRLLAQSA